MTAKPGSLERIAGYSSGRVLFQFYPLPAALTGKGQRPPAPASVVRPPHLEPLPRPQRLRPTAGRLLERSDPARADPHQAVLRPVIVDEGYPGVDGGFAVDPCVELERADDLRRGPGGLAVRLVLAGCAVTAILLIWLN